LLHDGTIAVYLELVSCDASSFLLSQLSAQVLLTFPEDSVNGLLRGGEITDALEETDILVLIELGHLVEMFKVGLLLLLPSLQPQRLIERFAHRYLLLDDGLLVAGYLALADAVIRLPFRFDERLELFVRRNVPFRLLRLVK
jgi:hypothetical protein